MLSRNLFGLASASGLTLVLAACGGGSTIGYLSSVPPSRPTPTPTPTPKPTPTPSPAPTPPPVPAGGPAGLQSSAPFATYAASNSGPSLVQFSYSAADNRYTISLPGLPSGQLTTLGGNGSFDDKGWIHLTSTYGSVAGAEGATVMLDWPASSDFKFTSHGWWYGRSGVVGDFAYGIPTPAGDVPVTGTATYGGSVYGETDGTYPVGGTVSMTFDFAAGTLSGVMKPAYADWDYVPLGDYVFRDTVFSPGSTHFSGAFSVGGKAVPSSFEGSFTGPQAAELMAGWTAPYNNADLGTGTMWGVWLAKKP